MRDAGVDPESALSQAQVDYVADAAITLAEPLDMPGRASIAGTEAKDEQDWTGNMDEDGPPAAGSARAEPVVLEAKDKDVVDGKEKDQVGDMDWYLGKRERAANYGDSSE